MSDEPDIIARLVRLETIQEELRREIRRVADIDEQKRMSLSSDINAKSELLVQLDTILRGANGDNGLCSRVRHLDARLEMSDAQIEGRLDRMQEESERRAKEARQDSEARHAVTRRYVLGLAATIVGALILRWLINT